MANSVSLTPIEELLGHPGRLLDTSDPHFGAKSTLQEFVVGHGIYPDRLNIGFAVFRTVYTPESDHLFPLAVKRIQDYFNLSIMEGKSNHAEYQYLYDEVLRRVIFPVLEDRDGLNNISPEDVRPHFEKWLSNQGIPTEEDLSRWPLYCTFIVIDEVTMLEISKLPEDPQILPKDRTGKHSKLCVKLVEFSGTENEAERPSFAESPYEAGLMKCHPRDLLEFWTDISLMRDFERVSGEPGHEYNDDGIPLFIRTAEALKWEAAYAQTTVDEA